MAHKKLETSSQAHLWLATDAVLFSDDPKGKVEELLDVLEVQGDLKTRKEIIRSIKKQDPYEAFMEQMMVNVAGTGVFFIISFIATKLTN